MATILYRLGRFAFRRAWYVLAAWVLILGGALGGGLALGGQLSDAFSIPGTESQNALDTLGAVFPQVGGASVQVVVEAAADRTVDDYRDAIADQVDAIESLEQVEAVVGPFDEYAGKAVNDDRTMAIIKVQFDGAVADVTAATIADLERTASITERAGMTVAFGGQVFQDQSFGVSIVELFGVIFAAVVLVITFGSLLSAGMPLLGSLIGVGIAMGGILGVAAFADVSSTAPMLALMIGLAVGIDYALFILSRHRSQLAHGVEPRESAGLAVGTAGSAVVFAGLTVIIALVGLLVVDIPFLTVMGIGAAFAVLIAIAIATTLLPALFGLAGHRLAPRPGSRAARRALAAASDATRGGSLGRRWVRLVMRAPIVFLVLVVGLLGTVAIPTFSIDLNLPNNGSEPAGTTQREAYDLTSRGFGAGFNGPLIVMVDITQTTDVLDDLDRIADRLRELPDVAYVADGIPDATVDTAIIQVTPSSAPDAPETKDLVRAIRDLEPSIEKRYDTPISVTGTTAIAIDISTRLTNALVPFLVIVVGLSVILLMMVFRSVLVPLKAALGFVLSIGASFGVVVAVFQWGWLADALGVEHTGPIISFLPIIIMAVLFGLAMDYEVFLVSGMREEFVHGGDPRRAVERGFANGARVVTAAALIMFFVFASFFPDGSGAIKPIALGLAVGIAIDAFLVRMTLVPAIMTLLGRVAWWMPRWLGRILPDVDVEGEALSKHREAVDWAADERAFAVSAEGVVAGRGEHGVGPIDVRVAVGSIVIASGTAADRRVLAATLSGRMDLVAGRAQVAGAPLPSEAAKVRRRVALADVGGSTRPEVTVTVGQLLRERLELTLPWYRAFATRRVIRARLAEVNRVAADVAGRPLTPITLASTLEALPQFERALALTIVALAERAPVVMLDQLDAFQEPDERAYLAAVDRLAAAATTVVIGTPLVLRDATEVVRPVVPIDLYALAERRAGLAHTPALVEGARS
ncbi:MMPL family transporter [Galbitalea sp. SE-J8]|uniref:MMPL family transporter n=1 Tax=Galbitalea sp. SE-J8 TaxID=3054952 RepID=UPI00259CADA2|nr:MMPL family transporter [Galbitalea sp. SE-J8]MDM4762667.1 MMPL family transporter [Galbitalea sp. SE-J8]